MPLLNNPLTGISSVAPKWYRIFNRVFPLLENAVIAGIMIFEPNPDAKGLLIYKVVSGFIRQAVDSVVTESE
tara:strand:- start:327 stop:542 length:216 start_codon:yes stop_codon:yes gene_type:complete